MHVLARNGSNIRHRAVEDKLMRQKAQFLLDEAASWSLLWYLYGKGNKLLPLIELFDWRIDRRARFYNEYLVYCRYSMFILVASGFCES